MGISKGILFVVLSLTALVLVGSALLVFALRRAPVGVETEEGFRIISLAEKTASATPASGSDRVAVLHEIKNVPEESDPRQRKAGNGD